VPQLCSSVPGNEESSDVSGRRALPLAQAALIGPDGSAILNCAKRWDRTRPTSKKGKRNAVQKMTALFAEAWKMPPTPKIKALQAGKCIATDDRRLKEKIDD
jgi:hypothetical protein